MRISDWSSDVCSSDLCGAPRRGEVVGTQPVLPDDDRISRDRANLLDEPAEMEGDLRIGGPIVGDGRLDGLGLAELVDLHHPGHDGRSEEHTSELQSLMRISYSVFCLQKKKTLQDKINKSKEC